MHLNLTLNITSHVSVIKCDPLTYWQCLEKGGCACVQLQWQKAALKSVRHAAGPQPQNYQAV